MLTCIAWHFLFIVFFFFKWMLNLQTILTAMLTKPVRLYPKNPRLSCLKTVSTNIDMPLRTMHDRPHLLSLFPKMIDWSNK